jgi:Translation initiation factor eIF3 subunit 135
MVEILHTHGVNMRYLGHMALLAHLQEQQDRDLLLSNRQRLQAMPLYWLEMLETEILARYFKLHLSNLFRANKVVRLPLDDTIHREVD